MNTIDNTVAWLPPSHPKSIITKSAAQLRKELEDTLQIDADVDENDEPYIAKMDVELPSILQVNTIALHIYRMPDATESFTFLFIVGFVESRS